ncbi:MAG: hypothetical protein EOP08_16190 [Proteobacteria bacterium]|nr:MAG: hypothetical protein EOP08_16190 [Pseudomonadota bacterium]
MATLSTVLTAALALLPLVAAPPQGLVFWLNGLRGASLALAVSSVLLGCAVLVLVRYLLLALLGPRPKPARATP